MATATETQHSGSAAAEPATRTHARRVRAAAKFPPWCMARAKTRRRSRVDPRQVTRILNSESGHNTIFDLALDGETHQGHDRGLAVRADQGIAAAHRPEAHRHGPEADGQVPVVLKGEAAGREDRGRHPGAVAARGRNRVLAGRHSQMRSKWTSAIWCSARYCA